MQWQLQVAAGTQVVPVPPPAHADVGTPFATPPPPLVVVAKDGCIGQRNFWGGGVVPNREAGTPPTPNNDDRNKTVLRVCRYDKHGVVVPSQRWAIQDSAGDGDSVTFALQDGTGRCLSVGDCVGGPAATAVLRKCIVGAGSGRLSDDNGAAIGCQAPWTEADEWPRPPAPTAGPCTAESSQQFVFSAPPKYWRNAIQFKMSGNCLELHGGKSPDAVDVDQCQNCTAPGCTVKNMEWHFNATSGALTSGCEPPCMAGGWCLTDANSHV